jgi:protein-tyrosine phosphatase
VIDLHAHILPGLDDGPPATEGSIAMAKAALDAGTKVIAATSHINRSFALQPSQLTAARMALREQLRAFGLPLDVVQGGEIAAGRAQSMNDGELRELTLGGGPWLLLECPLSPQAASIGPLVGELQARGFRVLLAHPERSPSFQRGPEQLVRLVDEGALAQVTSGAFAGHFGDLPRRTAFRMLERGLVHVLASDGHDAVHRGPDLLEARPAIAKRYEDAEAQLTWMAELAPAAILAGTALPERPPVVRRTRRGLGRFRA